MKIISISEFKKHCLSLIDTIRGTNEHITITKYGKPVAEVVPLVQDEEENNDLKGSILFEKDIVASMDDDWEADR
ncbi:MAG: type II toxin-antitoxin system Phd/YefM family antitoxin [Balneolaceae bacterium]|nr:type II toxin-antitoxin system Phd/YefM family antitoxin [Balneolaceae bacterium]